MMLESISPCLKIKQISFLKDLNKLSIEIKIILNKIVVLIEFDENIGLLYDFDDGLFISKPDHFINIIEFDLIF